MSVYLHFLFLILHSLVLSESNEIQTDKDASNFGPYEVTVDEFRSCKGPKSVDVAHFSTNVTKVDKSSIGFLNITILADTWLDQIRVYMYSLQDNVKKLLWNYRSNSPCRNFIASAIIQKFYNTSNCFVKKGIYASSLNFTDITIHIFGPKFFYGTYVARAHILSKRENIFCSWTSTNIRKLQLL